MFDLPENPINRMDAESSVYIILEVSWFGLLADSGITARVWRGALTVIYRIRSTREAVFNGNGLKNLSQSINA